MSIYFKKQCLFIALGILGCLLIASLFVSTPAYADSFETEQWKAVEITLTSSVQYSNPYLDVDMSATFTGPGGIVMTMPGFWDGGNTWRVRFAPTVTGTWTYSTSCTDNTNTGLNNQTGTITCNAYTGNLDIYKNGFLKADSSNRYLTYNNGVPYFWLGDTHWMGLSYRERLYSSNDSEYTSMFKGMVDKRASQGYNAYAMNFFTGEWGDISTTGTYNEGGHPWNHTGHSGNASSAYASNEVGLQCSPKKAFDGNNGTKWVASSTQYPQWLYIDMGTSTEISRIDTLFGSNDTWQYKIEGSNDYVTFTTLVDKTGGITGQVFSDTVNATVRYVKLTITGAANGSTAAVCEFTPYDAGGNPVNNAGLFKELNPSFWENTDERIQYIADKGLVSALGIDWGNQLEAANEADYMRVARYIVARYGAYPTLWLGSGEYAKGSVAGWGNISAYIYELDPYKRANTLHNAAWNPDNFRDQNWYNVDYLQGAHSSQKAKSFWLGHYNETPTKVVIEGEAMYENIGGKPTYYTRETAWNAIIGGCAGYTYGAEGLWQGTWDANDTWQLWAPEAVPWYIAIDKTAGRQMTYLKDFFTGIDWTALSPSATAITWNGAPAATNVDAPYQKANQDNSLIVAYLPSTTAVYTGTVNGLSQGDTYTAKWFNTRTGTYTTISSNFSPNSAGQWSVPSQPSFSADWALLIYKTTNKVEQPVANISGGSYTGAQTIALTTNTGNAVIYFTTDGSTPTINSAVYSSPINLSAKTTIKAIAVKNSMGNSAVMCEYYDFSNLVVGKSYSSSSDYNAEQTAVKAFDGSGSTDWQAGSSFAGEWLEVDFGKNTTFNEVVLTEYGYRTTAFRIEYWNGAAWQIAYTGARIGPDANTPKAIRFNSVTGTKARIYFISGTSRPIIYEMEIYNIPGQVTGLTATADAGSPKVALNWDMPLDAAGSIRYDIKRSTTKGGPYTTIADGVAETQFYDGNLTYGTTYYYVVSAVDTFGESSKDSEEASVLYRNNLALGKTYSSSSSIDANQIPQKAFDYIYYTDWQAGSGFANEWLEVDFGANTTFNQVILTEYGNRTTGYRIEYWNGSSWLTAYTGTTIGANSSVHNKVTFTSVTGSKARIYFTSGTGGHPIIYEFEIYNIPGTPTNLKMGEKNSKLTLSWTASTGASSYSVKRSATSGGPYSTVATGITTNSYTDMGLVNGVTYYYIVCAVSNGGESGYSAEKAGMAGANLALEKSYSSSSFYQADQVAGKAFDGYSITNWQAASGRFAGEWLEVDFGGNTTFDTAALTEYGNRTTGYRIEYWNGTSWITAYTGTTIGPDSNTVKTVTFAPVTGSKARLYFTSGSSQPIIYEFKLYDSSIVGNWKMNESSGAYVVDSSGYSNNGTINGDPVWTSGRSGNALQLDGDDDDILIADSSNLDGMSSLTVAGWFNLSVLPANNYVLVGKDSNGYSYRMAVDAIGTVQFVVNTTNNPWFSAGTVAYGSTRLQPGTWYHITGVYDGSSVKLYINGQYEGTGTQTISGSIVNSASPVRFGYKAASNINYLEGKTDEIMIYNRALNAGQVNDLYSSY